MAAADYYSQHPPSQVPSPYLAPPLQPQRSSSQPGHTFYPQHPSPGSQPQNYFPPPPYHGSTQQKPQVHFAQSPGPQSARLEQRNSFSHPQRPSPLQQEMQPNFPMPQNIPPFAPQNPAPWQHQGPYNPNARPYAGANQSMVSLSSGYSSDPEYHRRRHRHRHHHSDEGQRRDGSRRRDRKHSDTSRSGTTNGLIGATGGGLIGDLIFPGLGTVGGALAGWIGGKEYGNHRKAREEKLALEQEKWVKKYGRNLSPGNYDGSDRDRSRSRSRSRRRSRHE